MRDVRLWIALVAVTSAGCGLHGRSPNSSQPLPPVAKAAVEAGVRGFVITVAHDVTGHGPAAWRKYFVDGPEFFMASDGQLVFSDSQSATEGIQNLTHTINGIDLRWGDGLRVDPLTPTLAMVATPWAEVLTDAEGHQLTENGFFTGLAEYRNGRWQFRDAHWSIAAPSAKAP